MKRATEGNADVNHTDSALRSIKENLVAADKINKLDIADGLKELLINNGFTYESLLNTSVSDLAKILHIEEYIAKIIGDSAKKMLKNT